MRWSQPILGHSKSLQQREKSTLYRQKKEIETTGDQNLLQQSRIKQGPSL